MSAKTVTADEIECAMKFKKQKTNIYEAKEQKELKA